MFEVGAGDSPTFPRFRAIQCKKLGQPCLPHNPQTSPDVQRWIGLLTIPVTFYCFLTILLPGFPPLSLDFYL